MQQQIKELTLDLSHPPKTNACRQPNLAEMTITIQK